MEGAFRHLRIPISPDDKRITLMSESMIASLKDYFGGLDDPRAEHSIDHLLMDIVLITICAVICGAESWVEIENYGLAKQVWLAWIIHEESRKVGEKELETQ